MLLAIWLAFFAPLAKVVRFTALAFLLAPVIGFAATVRSVEWTGDMDFVVRYRWELTDAERLAEFQRQGIKPITADAAIVTLVAQPEDMPTYRGANGEGFVTGPALSQDWETSAPPLRWGHPCGGGYSQFAIVEPYAVTIEQRGSNEAVVCYDSQTGTERWAYEYANLFDEAMGGPGPRSTPVIHDGAVYSVGAQGHFVKLSIADGQPVWQAELLKDRGIPNTEWGITSSPLIVGDLVIVNPGGASGDGLEAYNTGSGQVVWSRPGLQEYASKPDANNRAGYSTPMLATLHGVEQIVMFDGTGVRGYVPQTGDLLWEGRFRNGAGVNVAQPLIFDDGRVFVSCSYDVGSAMFQVSHADDKWQVEKLWESRDLRSKFSCCMLVDGYIYGFDEGIFTCIDPETGERRWKKGRYGHGQMLATNGQILVHTEDGHLVLINPNPKQLDEVTRFKTLDDPKNWNPPALVRGRLFVRNHRDMACYDLTPQ
ncbi:MAG: PQQ-binding-like beta-propeller repeat protein [Planctomycetaceae bacterium]